MQERLDVTPVRPQQHTLSRLASVGRTGADIVEANREGCGWSGLDWWGHGAGIDTSFRWRDPVWARAPTLPAVGGKGGDTKPAGTPCPDTLAGPGVRG